MRVIIELHPERGDCDGGGFDTLRSDELLDDGGVSGPLEFDDVDLLVDAHVDALAFGDLGVGNGIEEDPGARGLVAVVAHFDDVEAAELNSYHFNINQ